MKDLLPASVEKYLKPTRQLVCWFSIKDAYEIHKVFNCPTFAWTVSDSKLFYGFPAINGRDGGFKIGVEENLAMAPAADPHRHNSEVSQTEIFEKFGDITQYFPHLLNSYVRSAACLYTMTPDEEFIIDRHPDLKNVWICSACSSHGFKFSFGIGIMLTDLVKNGQSSLWSDKFSLNRFDR